MIPMPSSSGATYIKMSAPGWPACLLPIFHDAPETMTSEIAKLDQTGRRPRRRRAGEQYGDRRRQEDSGLDGELDDDDGFHGRSPRSVRGERLSLMAGGGNGAFAGRSLPFSLQPRASARAGARPG